MMVRLLSSGDVKGKVQSDHRAKLREFLGRMYDEGGKDLQEKVDVRFQTKLDKRAAKEILSLG